MARKQYESRNKTKMIQDTILAIFDELSPRLTVRQIYYALTVRNVILKTESGYRQVCYQLKQMRLKEKIPYGWIADSTRWHIKQQSYTGLHAALIYWQSAYKKDLWASQDAYVEIWIEKDALAGVVAPITQEFDVPLAVVRGYSSATFIYESAEQIKTMGKPAYIYHFGDYDPSGVDAANKVNAELQRHGAQIHFERIAITEEQITRFNLPTRETKKSDPRAKKWGNKPSVELDALPVPTLRGLVRDCITQHIEADIWNTTLELENLERQTLEQLKIWY